LKKRSKRLFKITNRKSAKIEKYVVGIIEEIYFIKKSAKLVRIRTHDFTTNLMRKFDAEYEFDKFRAHDEYCEKIQNSIKSIEKRFQIVVPKKQMKPMSAVFTGESIYVSLSELARAAFPAISVKLELGAWLVLNRDAMQEIEGGSIVEYDMRWDDLPGTNIKTPFGALGILESYSAKTLTD